MATIRPELECVALAGKAGGLRTAALLLREAMARGSKVSFSSLAEALDNAADHACGRTKCSPSPPTRSGNSSRFRTSAR